MQHEIQVGVEGKDQTLADAANTAHNAAMHALERGIDRSQDEGIAQVRLQQALTRDPRVECFEVDHQIRQFRHGHIVARLVQLLTSEREPDQPVGWTV